MPLHIAFRGLSSETVSTIATRVAIFLVTLVTGVAIYIFTARRIRAVTMLIARVNARLGDFEMGQPGERVPEQSGQTPCCIAPPRRMLIVCVGARQEDVEMFQPGER
jgi:hypothetical protein